MRSRALPHVAFPPRSPEEGTTNGGSQAGRSQPIPAFHSENQQMAVKTNRILVSLHEPKVVTKSSIFLCKVLLNSLFVLCPAGEVRDTAREKWPLRARVYRPFPAISAVKRAGLCWPLAGTPLCPELRARRTLLCTEQEAIAGASHAKWMKRNGRKRCRWCKVCSVAHWATPTHSRINFTSERVCEAALTATEMELLECFTILENDFCLC